MISRVFGLLRDMMTSSMLGASIWNSAFLTAFTLPNLFRRLLGEGALTAALMPNLSEELEQGGRSAVHDLVNKTLSWLILICLGITLMVIGGFEVVKRSSVSEDWIIAARLGQVVFPYVLLICVAAILSAALNLFSRFGIPALTAVWLNASIIVALGIAGWHLGADLEEKTYWLCAGAMVGGLLQMVVPAIALSREGWRPRFDFSVSERVKEVALLTVPGIIGGAVFQVNILVSRVLAYTVNDSAASLLYYANRLVELPVGVFAIAISTVIFPSLTAAIAGARGTEFSGIYKKGVLVCLLLAVPSAVGLCVLAPEIIALLFERGEFVETDTLATVPLVIIFAIGMPFYSFIAIETRAFYALKDTRTPMRAAMVAFVINLVLSLSLMGKFGAVGLAIATNAAAVTQTLFLHVALGRKNLNTSLGGIFPNLFKVIVSAALMGIVVFLSVEWLESWNGSGTFALAMKVTFPIAVGVGVYFLALQLMGLKLKRALS
ncbi:murein biosynthesis integral membrane protein MurJ [Pelagicoccus albus]|uniref:Probable lipid II flippase MurJ n=2 Tax=Pelagicoccus albus TaxID=415222 RepID=A0A7X1BB57_9BACT|nr:murein biosynthesis integral membrane protein MurJ [Pelagicoccus albus]